MLGSVSLFGPILARLDSLRYRILSLGGPSLREANNQFLDPGVDPFKAS
jgi:hypothetical protein